MTDQKRYPKLYEFWQHREKGTVWLELSPIYPYEMVLRCADGWTVYGDEVHKNYAEKSEIDARFWHPEPGTLTLPSTQPEIDAWIAKHGKPAKYNPPTQEPTMTEPTIPPIGSIVRMRDKFWEIEPKRYTGNFVNDARQSTFAPGTLHEVLARHTDVANQIWIADRHPKDSGSSVCPIEWVELVEAAKPTETPAPTILETELRKAREKVAAIERIEQIDNEVKALQEETQARTKSIAEKWAEQDKLAEQYAPSLLPNRIGTRAVFLPDSETPGYCEPHQKAHAFASTPRPTTAIDLSGWPKTRGKEWRRMGPNEKMVRGEDVAYNKISAKWEFAEGWEHARNIGLIQTIDLKKGVWTRRPAPKAKRGKK